MHIYNMKKSIQNIIINQSNHIPDGFGNKYIYQFNRDVEFKNNMKVGLQSIKIYFSSFNISQEIGNNIITLKWFDTTTNIIIPDGYYEVSDFNFAIQKQLMLLGYYWYDANNNYYNWEFIINPTEYAINVNYYALPLASDASDFTKGSDSWNFPDTVPNENIIQLTLNPILSKMWGFSSQTTFPNVLNNSFNNLNDTQFSSDIAPKIQYISSYVIACNLVDSIYSVQNSNILASIDVNVEFGLSLVYNPPEIVYSDIKPSRYRQVEIEFLDQNFMPLKFKDKNILIILSILEEK
jgi:hypothetical protein